MPSPPIALFTTTIASQPVLRKRQEYLFRILQVKKIPFTAYDLASDEDAKRLWRRKAPPNKQQLPGILVGGKYPGSFEEFEEAVEHDELDIFLRLKESWDPVIDEERPMPEAKPIGVPGASTPLQMTPEHLKSKLYPPTASPSPLRTKPKGVPVNKRTDELDVGEELGSFGLQGVKVTEDELRNLIAELGLDDKDAGDLAKGLSDAPSGTGSESPAKEGEKEAPKTEVPSQDEVVPKEVRDTPEEKTNTEAAEEKQAPQEKQEKGTPEAVSTEAAEKAQEGS